MDNKEISKLLGRMCVGCEDGLRYAMQLFIEKVVLPSDCSSYSDKEMELYILNFLEKE